MVTAVLREEAGRPDGTVRAMPSWGAGAEGSAATERVVHAPRRGREEGERQTACGSEHVRHCKDGEGDQGNASRMARGAVRRARVAGSGQPCRAVDAGVKAQFGEVEADGG
ncbi:hypothetical protein Sgou_40530 [Streptomyces gougerotii]|uniref:Uncharacterized protein n=1 Tax=Streptomyces gougerotii TaxID=53448 RepID=A0A8H9LFW9_9ACTN|nr:hypothetical protein Sgou_40530 [Streptomyces gougerotii]GGU53878.1 hypothetical protein GCM10010227_03660 [Streptomyces gougerotii]